MATSHTESDEPHVEQFDRELVDTDSDEYPDYGLDPRLKSAAGRGVPASRKHYLTNAKMPLSSLAADGVTIPHREFNPEDAREFPSVKTITDPITQQTVTVSLFQDVREDMDDDFGNFGSVSDDEDVIWTVTDLTDETVNLVVVGDWGNRREVGDGVFAGNYEPVTVETGQGVVPKFGY